MKLGNLARLVFGAFVISLVTLAAPAGAYEDAIYKFSVRGPQNWIVLPDASVPGSYRFGWTSPEWAKAGAKNVWGASIAVFVQDTGGNSAKDLLDKNVAVITGKTDLKPDPRANLKVVKQQLITIDGRQGFVMEVVGSGTGFAIGVPRDTSKNAQSAFKMVPTRQRWFCVVKDKMLIGLLSTCPDSLYSTYMPTFAATEKTFKLY